MVYAPKEIRNQKLVEKRIKDPKKWSWAKLGQQFEIHRSVAKQIFERDMEKFANEEEIERYENLKSISQKLKRKNKKRL